MIPKYTRPDQTRTRIALAIRMIERGDVDCRDFDRCFEMHDGSEVMAAVRRHARRHPEFAAQWQKLRHWLGDAPTNSQPVLFQ